MNESSPYKSNKAEAWHSRTLPPALLKRSVGIYSVLFLFIFCLLLLQPFLASAQNITEGLMGYYTFCDCTAKDGSGQNRHGVVMGSPQCIKGIRDRGLLLNQSPGTNSCGQRGGEYIQLPASGAVWADGFTVCAWVRFDEIKNYERIIDFSNATGEMGGLPVWFGREGNSNNLTLESWINADGAQARSAGRLVAPNVITNGRIEFYCATISNDTMSIYVNGNLVAQKKGNPIANVPRANNYIGRSAWCQNDPDFKGFIDEVRIYNRALDLQEIQNLYQYTNITDFEVTRTCNTTQTTFAVAHAYDIDSLQWNFGDAASGHLNTSNLPQAEHTFSSFGSYDVRLIVYKPCVNDTVLKKIWIAPPSGLLGADVELCPGSDKVLRLPVKEGNYLWQDGSTADTLLVTTPGIYWLQVRLYNCIYTDSVIVRSARKSATLQATICSGQSYLGYSVSGTYLDTFQLNNGCDSIRTLQLTVLRKMVVTRKASICPGQSYSLPWGSIVATPGTYRDTIRYTSGCDSVIHEVNVSIATAATESSLATLCTGQTFTLPWGLQVNAAGVYSHTIKSIGGCDSIIRTINLVTGATPVVSISKSNDVDCIIGNTRLSASGGNTYSWSPAQTLDNALLRNPVASPSTSTWYKVTATAANGCTAEDSIEVKVNLNNSKEGHLVPSAFTPNGDGKNDCFGLVYWGSVASFSMSVYNRWGERVFYTTTTQKCWNGKVGNNDAAAGTYVYYITAVTPCGTVSRRGTFVLLR